MPAGAVGTGEKYVRSTTDEMFAHNQSVPAFAAAVLSVRESKKSAVAEKPVLRATDEVQTPPAVVATQPSNSVAVVKKKKTMGCQQNQFIRPHQKLDIMVHQGH